MGVCCIVKDNLFTRISPSREVRWYKRFHLQQSPIALGKKNKKLYWEKTFEQRGLLQEYLEEEKLYDPNINEDSLLSSFYLQRVAKYFDGDIYYGTITTSKPFKSDKGILLWHVQYDDEDSEDLNKEELIQAIELFKSKLIT